VRVLVDVDARVGGVRPAVVVVLERRWAAVEGGGGSGNPFKGEREGREGKRVCVDGWMDGWIGRGLGFGAWPSHRPH
jgi:hypothetical protein